MGETPAQRAERGSADARPSMAEWTGLAPIDGTNKLSALLASEFKVTSY